MELCLSRIDLLIYDWVKVYFCLGMVTKVQSFLLSLVAVSEYNVTARNDTGTGRGNMGEREWTEGLIHWPPRTVGWNLRLVIFKLIVGIYGWGISYEIALSRMSLSLVDVNSTLVQVMAWYLTAPSHYLSQCWYILMWPYGITRSQWFKIYIGQSHHNRQLRSLRSTWCIYRWVSARKT